MLDPLRVPHSHAVIKKGEEADSMFFIIAGEVDVKVDPEPIKLRQGDFFGETGILRNTIRMADVVSVTDCQLLELRKDKFNELILIYPELGRHVEQVMESRMAQKTSD